MDTIRDKTMVAPDVPTAQWVQFVEAILPWATIFGLCFKALDLVFKYYSAAQDARLKTIVNDMVSPEIEKLSTAIDNLREAIWEMKQT